MLQAVGGWLAKWFAFLSPQKADFEALNDQYRRWAADLSAHYETLNRAQQDRVTALEAAAARYREWTDRHIVQLQHAEERCREERGAALVRIKALEAEVTELKAQVQYLLAGK